MSDTKWQPTENHPSAGELLLFVEGELDGRAASSVRRHLRDCWECRARSQDLTEGIRAFVSARRDVLVPSLPQPPSTRSQFSNRLARESEPTRLQGVAAMFRLVRPSRPAWTMSAVPAGLAAVLFFLSITQPPTMTAGEFLMHVRTARAGVTVPANHVVRHRVVIRRGNWQTEKEIVRGTRDEPDRDLPIEGPVDWDDPMDPTDFERWRATTTVSRDDVHETQETMTLATTPEGGSIRLASLTVRRSDWRPVAKHVVFADLTSLDIEEISYAVEPESLPEVLTVTPTPQPLRPIEPASVATPILPMEDDLERSEIRVREALHSLEADRRELPMLERDSRGISVSALVETENRGEQLRSVLQAIPYVTVHIRNVNQPLESEIKESSAQVTTVKAPIIATEPPLAEELWEHLGGLDAANNYLELVRKSYFQALSDALALRRLAERYPADQRDTLPADVRERVDRLAADYILDIQPSTELYLKNTSMVLDVMLERHNVAAPETHDAETACRPWQEIAPMLVAMLERTQSSFQRLFLVDESPYPVELVAEELLAETSRYRVRLTFQRRSLCLPGYAPESITTDAR